MVYLAPDLGVPVSVDVVRANVHATLGSFEDLEHSLHFRAKAGYSGPNDQAALQTFAGRLGAAWLAWWNNATALGGLGTSLTKAAFSSQLIYNYIDVSYLTYPGAGEPPVTVTPTSRWMFPTPLAGTSTNPSLPLEVACCMTFLTDTASSRTRGRMYLGGLCTDWMDTSLAAGNVGFFNLQMPRGHAARFGVSVVDGIHSDAAANYELNVVSRMGGSARGVGGIRVGAVPDSQRRRRWHQPENPWLAWGTP